MLDHLDGDLGALAIQLLPCGLAAHFPDIIPRCVMLCHAALRRDVLPDAIAVGITRPHPHSVPHNPPE